MRVRSEDVKNQYRARQSDEHVQRVANVGTCACISSLSRPEEDNLTYRTVLMVRTTPPSGLEIVERDRELSLVGEA